MTMILGIDPGSRITGYGLLKYHKNKLEYIDCGCIRLNEDSLSQKLKTLYEGLCEIVMQFKPNECAIEQIFMHKNANSALKLGHARGVAILAASSVGYEVAEYSARQIKQATVGYGGASKEQVQQMVKHILSLNKQPQSDAADALSVAVCHAHNLGQLNKYPKFVTKYNKGRVR